MNVERVKLIIILGCTPTAILISLALASFLLPKTILDGIEIKETTISSLLTAVSIMFGVIFAGYFYFRDKSIEQAQSVLNLERKLSGIKFTNTSFEANREAFTEDILPEMDRNLENMLYYHEIFFPIIFVLFSVAILVCIAALVIDNERFDQFVLEYVGFNVIWFTMGFSRIWYLVDKTIKSMFKIHQMIYVPRDSTSKDT